jgi:mannose-6-phosphate isomerase-like protein (cupin superfamily)
MSVRPRVILRAEQTGGAVSAIEVAVAAGWAGPPLHHHAFDETFYVLEGRLTFQVGDELVEAGPGTLVFAPGGATHTLANLADGAARYPVLCSPAGFERYFDRIAAELADVAPPPEAAGPIPETIVVGPTLADRVDLARPRSLPAVQGGMNVLVRAEHGEGRIAVMDNGVAADVAGPPLHHHDFDELFYVLDGELTFQLGRELVTRRAGGLAFAPRGGHHTFANLSGAPARTLIVCTPAGFERYFARIAAERQGVEPPAWAMQSRPEVTTVGPQISAAD